MILSLCRIYPHERRGLVQQCTGLLCYNAKDNEYMKEWAETFYNSQAWRECRETYLQSKGYLCERCSTPGNPVIAKVVHHKTYLTKININNPYITLSWDNLEALCQDCHNKEHHKSSKGMQKEYKFTADGSIIPISPPVK